MWTGTVALTIVYISTAFGLPPFRDVNNDRPGTADSLINFPEENKDVYYKHMTLPLSTFVGENKFEYGCSAFLLKPNEYIVEYLPLGERDDTYHITISVCDIPYDESPVWECINPAHVCKNQRREVMYAWTNGAPGWILPEYAGVYTGDKQQYIILQVHGRDDISDERAADSAHFRLKIQKTRPPLDAAISIYSVGGYVPAHVENFTADVACVWNMTTPSPVIAYGLHTHSRGLAQSGYIVRNGKWIEIGRGDPLYPLVLFDVTDRNLMLHPGDIIATRCTYRNTGDTDISMGSTHLNEMCNLFLHYGVSHENLAETKSMSCSSSAQNSDWEIFDHIPVDASNPNGDTDQARYVKKYQLTHNY
ncbi:peptidyl-glycine alpha-amidating monooxygenase B-like [Ylistrum balloti]|uniref:peptidyl-glycine alpha-amidating monooxygenase B-like n=1 Tax=Ylistrum balloti TaxID=509963 RepID=UPI002905D93E|nr:peptidyl-glycine alpha-amidating monooxygenase B-like [Ylistrum balloti]